jgi:hypothetical protein
MTREEFKEILRLSRINYNVEGDLIVIDDSEVFSGAKDINLISVQSLPYGVKFINSGDVYLTTLRYLSPGVDFCNGGDVVINEVLKIPPGVKFENEGDAYFGDMLRGEFRLWSGNMEGVDPKRLLNHMISKGIFI